MVTLTQENDIDPIVICLPKVCRVCMVVFTNIFSNHIPVQDLLPLMVLILDLSESATCLPSKVKKQKYPSWKKAKKLQKF